MYNSAIEAWGWVMVNQSQQKLSFLAPGSKVRGSSLWIEDNSASTMWWTLLAEAENDYQHWIFNGNPDPPGFRPKALKDQIILESYAVIRWAEDNKR